MMDEFYETFDVKESNNMYIAPESRLRIWGPDVKYGYHRDGSSGPKNF